jgi:hypothetical protein
LVPVTKTSVDGRLRELEERYARELMGEEERLELRERILKLKRKATRTTAGGGRDAYPLLLHSQLSASRRICVSR